jgi:hypothetical protein
MDAQEGRKTIVLVEEREGPLPAMSTTYASLFGTCLSCEGGTLPPTDVIKMRRDLTLRGLESSFKILMLGRPSAAQAADDSARDGPGSRELQL